LIELPRNISIALPEEDLAHLAQALRGFPSYVRGRGEDYVLAGRVHECRLDDRAVVASVRGTRTYAVRWTFRNAAAVPLCTCPAGPICKHAYATGLAVLAAARADGRLGADATGLLPSALERHATGRTPPPPPSLARTQPVKSSQLAALRDAGSAWLRLDAAQYLLRKHGFPQERLGALDLGSIAHEDDPDVRCWRLAHAIEREWPGRVPKPLAPYLVRPELEARGRERQRQQVVERITHWAGASEPTPRHLRVILGLVEDAAGPRVTLEARLTTSRLKDEPRTWQQLGQLHAELRREPHLLSPPQARLLRMLTEPELASLFDDARHPGTMTNDQLNLLLDRAAGSSFVTWSPTLPARLAARAGIKPGARADLEGDDLRMTLEAHTQDGELRLSLALVGPDGALRPVEQALVWSAERVAIAAHPSIALLEGAFHRIVEEPPADIVRTLAEMQGIPLKREDGPLLDRLSARFPAVAAALESLTRTFDARPVVSLDLRPSDWLQVRVFAVTGDTSWGPGDPAGPGRDVFEYAPDHGWVRAAAGAPGPPRVEAFGLEGGTPPPETEAPPPAGIAETPASAAPTASPWREVPAPVRVAGALTWLERVLEKRGSTRGRGRVPGETDAGTGWWLRLDESNIEALFAAWQERPRDTGWFGNDEVRRLFEGVRRVHARLNVVASGMNWLTIRAEWEGEGLALTDADLASLRESKRPFVRLAGGWARREEAESQDALAAALADLGLEPGAEEQKLSVWQLAQVRGSSLEQLASAGAGEATLETIARVREAVESFQGLPRIPLPAGFSGELRPYQQDGLDFLAWTTDVGLGAVLADDMGLGKTVQALAWLARLREREPDAAPALVVCPASVMHNWEREAARFTPRLKVLVLGSGRDRRARMAGVRAHDLVVTNYALLRRDAERWRELELSALVFDEAQNVKNPDAAVSRAAREMRARHRLALTGTPLENRALDLWSILAIVNPGWLGPRARFVTRYDRPDAPPHVRRLLSARLRPVLLRRLKEQVARELPPRIEERLDCEMTAGQRKLYAAELVRSRELLRTIAPGEDGLAKKRLVVLAVLTRLRQICCHPALAGGKRELGSGKFEALFDLLEPLLAEGRKVLVFSQFVECLKLIAGAMDERAVPYHMLTGSTSTRDRGGVVDAFTNDTRPCAFLVSLKAGGTGLNLVAARDVVLFDPWWNPAVEAQAIDRTHRIGQDHTVVAYRLLSEGTIEEKIAELQQRKAKLVKDVLGEDGFSRTLSRADLEYLLAD
jgi:superfamily II DNA or RNA helicase